MTLDFNPLGDLLKISWGVNQSNVGDSFVEAISIYTSLPSSPIKFEANVILQRLRNYSRDATYGWSCFSEPIHRKRPLKTERIMQFIGFEASLRDLNYCFECIQDAAYLTFENSTPVRFYVNGIFNYVTALFLLDIDDNLEAGYPKAGKAIRVLYPLGLGGWLDPIYNVLDRPFGEKYNYGATMLLLRNRDFVHGSFSIKDIKDLAKDSNIFDVNQKAKFVQNHLDLADQLILLRLRTISLLTLQKLDPANFSPEKLFLV